MSLQVLKDELTADPLGRGYSGMTDAEAADDLNTAYRESTMGSFNNGVAMMYRHTDEADENITHIRVVNNGPLTLVLEFERAGQTDHWEVGAGMDATYQLTVPVALAEAGGVPLDPMKVAMRWQSL